MKHSFRNFTHVYLAPANDGESGGSSGGGGSSVAHIVDDRPATVNDAMAELDRREAARAAKAKADKAAAATKRAKAARADEDDADPEDGEHDPRKVEADDDEPKPKKGKPAAKDEPEAAEEDDDGEDDSTDDDASDDDAETTDDDGEEGDDSDEDKDSTSDSLDDDDTVEIEHEGAKHRVPKALEKAFMRHAEFTQKTTELAQERHVNRQAYQVAHQVVQQAQGQVQLLAQYAQAMIGDEPDPSLAVSDLQGYTIAKAQREQRMQALGHIQREVQRAQQHQQQLQHQQVVQHLHGHAAALMQHAPELRDPKKREALTRDAWDAAKRYGFTREDMQQLVDHRMLLMLREHARLLQGESRHKAATESVRKKLANVPPKQAKPGLTSKDPGKNRGNSDAKARFMKSGRSMKDAQRALARMR